MITQNVNPSYKIGLYVRNSNAKQDTPEGTVKNQEQRLREFVQLKSLSGDFGKIVGVYIDRSLSGKNMERPSLQRLMSDVSEEKINLILVSELSRISRSMRDFLSFWDLLKEHKCGFSSLRENVDTSNAAGEMVLRTIVNIAQFEREQTSERILANTKARSKRGLTNGGTIPLGYKAIPDKPGYLAIDPEWIEVVKKAFDAFLKIEMLNPTAKWLNKNNIRPRQRVEGGGQARLGYFHIGNLHYLLKNKTYKGVREYQDGENLVEVPAVWEGIIAPEKFDKVQGILSKNHRRRKPFTKTRWPYTLSGLTYCLKCQGVLCGKSAHGGYRKYGYYEHGWASKRGSAMVKNIFKCDPHRVPAEKLEAVIDEHVKELLNNEDFARSLIEEGHRIHRDNSGHRELIRLKKMVSGYESHETALVARLAELPADVSAAPIYKQLKEIQEVKEKAENSVLELASKGCYGGDEPAILEDYQTFLAVIKWGMEQNSSKEWKSKVIAQLIGKIEVGTDRVKIHWRTGQEWLKTELEGKKKPSSSVFFKNICSRTLHNGGSNWTRTNDLILIRDAL